MVVDSYIVLEKLADNLHSSVSKILKNAYNETLNNFDSKEVIL